MIEHLVLLKMKADAPAEEADRMIREMKNLARHIPTIRELTCGKNTSDQSQGFTHGLRVRFECSADLEAYIAHPAHQRVVEEFVGSVVDELIVVDYEA